MAAKYRKIAVRIWNDEKFVTMTDRGKLAFLFLLTHPHMTALGAMRGTLPGLAAELGWQSEAFGEAFGEAFAKGMVRHDSRVSFIALPNFLRHNPPESPNVITSWSKCVDLIPECTLKHELLKEVKAFTEGLGEGFRKAFAKSMPNQEQEQEQDNIKDIPPAKSGSTFVPVAAYAINPAITWIDINGTPTEYHEHPGPWEAEFIRQWNSLKGVHKRTEDLDGPLRFELQQRLCDENWFWKRAFAMFPLKGNWDHTQNLSWFLKPKTVSAILDGTYHPTETPKTKGKKNDRPLTNPGQVQDLSRVGKGVKGWGDESPAGVGRGQA
jgi:hypothetical protein